MYQKIIKELDEFKNPKQAKNLQRFFKTGKGEYGEGDIFLGLKMPQIRGVVKNYFVEASLDDAQKLLNSKIHEYRMTGVLILVKKYKTLGEDTKGSEEIFNLYFKNTRNINNWDLVDLSAPNIVGKYLLNNRTRHGAFLHELAQSKNLWERRIAVLATFAFICEKKFIDIIKIAKNLLQDEHDLIHKAVGWMLREMGKKDEKGLIKFLDQYTCAMPRTMLRYSIEKLPEKKRKYYLEKK
ncbi:MAG: DNA alkylation repair protein [Patescibacteria group bacterium]